MAGLFNIFSSTCLERLTRSLKGVFHFLQFSYHGSSEEQMEKETHK